MLCSLTQRLSWALQPGLEARCIFMMCAAFLCS